ncbi:hypothetical protein BH23GEM8_BH23GEM8_04760 [soil metagenome]
MDEMSRAPSGAHFRRIGIAVRCDDAAVGGRRVLEKDGHSRECVLRGAAVKDGMVVDQGSKSFPFLCLLTFCAFCGLYVR